jgi:Carboxypeptidase regulatory-like domain/TonB dependent receptor/TonB-dependent Receptor Plug Domain
MLRGFIVFCLAVPMWAQVTRGSISGYVLDPSQGPISNATITISDSDRSVARSAATDSTGYYRLEDLAPSTYRVTAAVRGFRPQEFSNVQVEVNAQTRVDFHLEIAGQSQSVTVLATEAGVASESSDLGMVIGQDRISGLPLNERDFLQLALLTPGVTTPVEGSELSSRGAFAMHANGAREEYNDFLLDGVDNNDQYTNRYILQPSVDAIEEFKIATNSYSAEYGRNAGAQVNVITRSGSNALHGFAYDYLRNRVLDAINPLQQGQKPQLIRNQFGGGMGGAIIKNKTFFFVSGDALRGVQGIAQYATVPTVAERQGDFSALGGPVIDPLSSQPFPGNAIPASRVSPLSARVLALFPLPNLPGVSGNYFGEPIEQDNNTQLMARLDQQFSASTRLSLRYSYGRSFLAEPFTQGSTEVPGFGDYVWDSGHNAMIDFSHNLSPNTIDSLIVGMNRAPRRIYQQNYKTNVNQLWGVNYLPTDPIDYGYPSISIAGFSLVGDVTEIPNTNEETTYQVSDTLSMVHGAHGIKFGGEVRNIRLNSALDLLGRGSMSFTGALSGFGITDLFLGYPTYTIQSKFDNPQTQRTTSYALFFQDDWKVNRKLTLNLGLRYEYNSPPTDPTNRLSAFNLATGTVNQVGTDGLSRSGIKPDWTNFAPRIGLAYALTDKTIIRSAYGIFYDAGMLTVNSALYFNPPYFNVYLFTPSPSSLLTLNNPFPLQNGFIPPPGLSTLSPDITTSYIQSWNVNIQHMFSGLGTLSVAYAGSKGTHLIRSLDLNQPEPGPGPINSRSLYPQYSNIFFTESGADSEYQSLQISINRRLSRGLTLLGAYTFSKSMDDTSAFLNTMADPNFPQNSHDYHAEHALSSFDTPSRFVAAVVYSLPFKQKAFRNLQVASIITAQSGQPFTPVLEFDNSNTGNTGPPDGSDRPNVVGSPALPHPSAQEWFNTAAFAIPAEYTFGNAGRNILRGPGAATVDFSLSRRFTFAERWSLLAQAQVFNMLNRENLNLPDAFADNPATFGKIFSAKDPRQVQLVLRLAF